MEEITVKDLDGHLSFILSDAGQELAIIKGMILPEKKSLEIYQIRSKGERLARTRRIDMLRHFMENWISNQTKYEIERYRGWTNQRMFRFLKKRGAVQTGEAQVRTGSEIYFTKKIDPNHNPKPVGRRRRL